MHDDPREHAHDPDEIRMAQMAQMVQANNPDHDYYHYENIELVTVGIDIGSKVDIHQIIAGLSAEKLGTIVISDDLPELIACCHRILVMKDGHIVNEFAADKTNERELAEELAS